jgi:beta-lactamase class A
MKTPVLIELYKQSEAGTFSMSDSIRVKNEFYSIVDSSLYSLSVDDDSESELYSVLGSKRTIADLAYDMIIVSSNLATNLVIDLVDARKVTQSMRELGAPDIQVLRGVEDIKAYELGMSNTTTAYDLMAIYEKIAQGEAVSQEASEAMIDILLDQKFNDIIPAHLPEEVKVAHKTGSITGVHHDSGIVFLPDGRKYVLVLLSKELQDFAAGTALLAEVSKLVYDYVR